jgi:hypothetical protein
MGFIVTFPYIQIRYFDQIHTLYYFSYPHFCHFLNNFSMFHYSIFMHVCKVLWSCSPLLSPSYLPWLPSWKQSLSYTPIIHFHRSRFHIWDRTCEICLSRPSLFHLSWCLLSTHFPANNSIAFFFMAEWYSVVYVRHVSFVPSSVVVHLDWCHGLPIMNSTAVDMVCRCLNLVLTYILQIHA